MRNDLGEGPHGKVLFIEDDDSFKKRKGTYIGLLIFIICVFAFVTILVTCVSINIPGRDQATGLLYLTVVLTWAFLMLLIFFFIRTIISRPGQFFQTGVEVPHITGARHFHYYNEIFRMTTRKENKKELKVMSFFANPVSSEEYYYRGWLLHVAFNAKDPNAKKHLRVIEKSIKTRRKVEHLVRIC